jgi:hypothetical protein
MSDINETLKKKIDELDLDKRLNALVDDAEKTFHKVLGRAGSLAHERREEIERTFDRFSDVVDERTAGRYADRVEQVRERLDLGLDRLAERRPEAEGATDADTGPGTQAGPDGAPEPTWPVDPTGPDTAKRPEDPTMPQPPNNEPPEDLA